VLQLAFTADSLPPQRYQSAMALTECNPATRAKCSSSCARVNRSPPPDGETDEASAVTARKDGPDLKVSSPAQWAPHDAPIPCSWASSTLRGRASSYSSGSRAPLKSARRAKTGGALLARGVDRLKRRRMPRELHLV